MGFVCLFFLEGEGEGGIDFHFYCVLGCVPYAWPTIVSMFDKQNLLTFLLSKTAPVVITHKSFKTVLKLELA